MTDDLRNWEHIDDLDATVLAWRRRNEISAHEAAAKFAAMMRADGITVSADLLARTEWALLRQMNLNLEREMAAVKRRATGEPPLPLH